MLFTPGELEDLIFYKSLSILLGFFNRHVVPFFDAGVLKEVCFLHVIHTVTVQY